MAQSNNSGVSIGFTGLLTILFIALKLTKIITWSWFWILFPVLFPFWLGLFLIVVGFIGAGLSAGYLAIKKSKKQK